MKASKSSFGLLVMTLVAASSLTAVSSFADDESVKSGLEKAMSAFNHRSAVDSQPIDTALSILESVEGQADDPDLNFDVLVLESRALYWKGVHAKKNEDKLSIHSKGQAKAKEAREMNDGYAEGYYYYGTHLARWAEARGVIESLGRKDELVKSMKDTMSHPTRDNQMGESIDGYGPDRVFGKMYFKLPSLFGGSHTESVRYFQKAYTNAKNYASNAVYYAEALYAGDSEEKSHAKKVLDELLMGTPETYNVNRIPESMDDFAEARALRAKM